MVRKAETLAAASTVAYEAAMALYDDVFGSHALATDLSAMQTVIDHVIVNLDKPLPVDELAAVSGLSRSHFSRVLPKARGCRRPSSRCSSACSGRNC